MRADPNQREFDCDAAPCQSEGLQGRTPRNLGGRKSVSAFMRWTKGAGLVSLVPESGWPLLHPRADGPTRRSSSVSRGGLDGATANSLAADHHGPLQDDQAVKTKLLTGSCLRGLDQGLGSTRARCSRNRSFEPLCTMAWLAQGWAGHPCHIRQMQFTSMGTPAPDVDALCLVPC